MSDRQVHVVQCRIICPTCGQSRLIGAGYKIDCERCGALLIGVDHNPTAADQKLAEETLAMRETAEIKFQE